MTGVFESTAKSEPGKGSLVCKCYNNQVKFEKMHAQYPLKFIATHSHTHNLAIVYMLTYGGGVVSGDVFNVDITVKEKAILLLLTQGNTKIFKDRVQQRMITANSHHTHPSAAISGQDEDMVKGEIAPSIQIIESIVSTEGTLVVLPDPVTCFKKSSFQSKQRYHLADNKSQLVLLDWVTSGRASRGESWLFKHYSSRIDISVDSKLIIKDAMVLEDEEYMRDPNSTETSYGARLKPYTCFATLVIISKQEGGPLLDIINSIQHKSQTMRLSHLSLKSDEERSLLWASNPILNDRGVLVRVSGMSTEKVRDFIKYECLGKGLENVIGTGMFSKILM